MHRHRWAILISLLLVLVTLVAYHHVRGQHFVLYDDAGYVSQNDTVRQGLSLQGIAYAFTAAEASYWHPVTWLSHMLDCQLFGLDAGAHKEVSVVIHCVNALLLLVLLQRITGSFWRSAIVAALFALHPLNVESVAWVAERKNLLSTFFGLLTILAYTGYVRRPGAGRYVLTLVLFVLGLMAKPILVTLPCVLLLLDYWPLRRWPREMGEGVKPRAAWRIVGEKVPFFLLSAASCVVTVFTNRQLSGTWMDSGTFAQRFANAAVSYARYIGKMFWPTDLVCIYPQQVWTPWQVAAAATLLLGITIVAIRLVRRQPALLVGWLWFLGTLVPTLNLVASGPQAMADRYAYFSLIGLFIAIVFSIPASTTRASRAAVATVCTCVLLALAIRTDGQVTYWQDTQTLFTHAIEHTDRNYVAEVGLATDLSNRGEYVLAEPYFQDALRIEPRYPIANTNYGYHLLRVGKYDAAIGYFHKALQTQPRSAAAHQGLGIALERKGDWSGAAAEYEEAVRLKPQLAASLKASADRQTADATR